MYDYELFHYGKQTGLIIEAECEEDALEQIVSTGLQNRGDNFNLVKL